NAIRRGAADDNQVAVHRVIAQPALRVVDTEEKERARALGPGGDEGGGLNARHDVQDGENARLGAVVIGDHDAIVARIGQHEVGEVQGCVGGDSPGDFVGGPVGRG